MPTSHQESPRRKDTVNYGYHTNWTVNDWKKVFFTDETRVRLRGPDGYQRVWGR